MDAFDADVLIYAAAPDHPLGRPVRALLSVEIARSEFAGVGSVLLLPEVLSKPLASSLAGEIDALSDVLARLDLRPVDQATADVATVLAARYRLRAADAVHLATAVVAGADRFITNNRRDFGKEITEVSIVYPDELGPPTAEPVPPTAGGRR